jgi:hypothetical protein
MKISVRREGSRARRTTRRALLTIEDLEGRRMPALVVPPAPILDAASDTGASQSDGITNRSAGLAFDVDTTGLTGLGVVLLRDGQPVHQYAVAAGITQVTDPGPVPDGVHSYTLESSQGAQVSSPGAATTVTVDTTPPPTPSSPTLLFFFDVGAPGAPVSKSLRPLLFGTGEIGATIRLVNAADGTVMGTGTVASGGSFAIQVALTAGVPSTVYSQAMDAAGNYSGVYGTLTVTADPTPPPTPSPPSLPASFLAGAPGTTIANSLQPVLTGTAKPGVTVRLVNAATGALLATATADSNGSYAAQVASPLAAGATYSIYAQAVDALGGYSGVNGSLTVTIDPPPPTPAPPSLSQASAYGLASNGIATTLQPILTGTAKPGATVRLVNAASGALLATATAGADGSYAAQVASPMADGRYSIYAQAVDALGAYSGVYGTLSLTIDSAPPSTPPPPSLRPSDQTGGPGVTSAHQPVLTGTATPGATVRLVNAADGTVLATATAGVDGTYAAQVASPLVDGGYTIYAQAVDALGIYSGVWGTLRLTIVG